MASLLGRTSRSVLVPPMDSGCPGGVARTERSNMSGLEPEGVNILVTVLRDQAVVGPGHGDASGACSRWPSWVLAPGEMMRRDATDRVRLSGEPA